MHELGIQDAKLMERAVRGEWQFSDDEWAEFGQAALRLVRVPGEHRDAIRAWSRGASLGVAMRAHNHKVRHQDEDKPQVPSVNVLVQGDAQITVAPSAMTSFLADCTPAVPTPQVIEHQANPPEQSPS